MKRFFRRVAVCTAIIVVAWVIGFLCFMSLIPEPEPDNAPPTDAIVVLTGGKGRIERGLSLLEAGKAPLLFISGVEPHAAPERLVQQFLPSRAHDAAFIKRIALGRRARNTIGNVLEVTQWVRANHVRSVRLVTANYHMPRALAEFSSGLPHEVILPEPIVPEDFDMRRAWQPGSPENLLLLSEYHKWLAAYARHAFLFLSGPRR